MSWDRSTAQGLRIESNVRVLISVIGQKYISGGVKVCPKRCTPWGVRIGACAGVISSHRGKITPQKVEDKH